MQNGQGSPSILLLSKQKNSKKQGDIGLAIAIAWFEMNGYPTLIPLTDSQDYDLGIDLGHKIARVQVRTTYHKKESGVYKVNLAVSGGNRSGIGKIKYFDPQKVDYLFVVTETLEKYFIPSILIEARRVVTLSDKYAEYKVE